MSYKTANKALSTQLLDILYVDIQPILKDFSSLMRKQGHPNYIYSLVLLKLAHIFLQPTLLGSPDDQILKNIESLINYADDNWSIGKNGIGERRPWPTEQNFEKFYYRGRLT